MQRVIERLSRPTKRDAAVGLLAALVLLAACGGAPETPVSITPEPPVTETQVTAETRVVVETRVVERTVVVTATPPPTPAYFSRTNAPAGVLVYPLAADPTTLDPQQAVDEVSGFVVEQLYEGLFHLRSDGTTAPAAATDVVISPSGDTYTVTLRADLAWSDGEPVTAQQYVDGVCRLLEPEIGNSYYYLLTEVAPIVGAREFASGDTADCASVGVQAVDDRTLVFRLAQPSAFFPKLLAFRVFLPFRAEMIGGEAGRVTNGPYVLEEWLPGESMRLATNPQHWNAGESAVARIELPIIPDAAEQLARYEAGDLHVAEFPAEETARIQADETFAQELQVLVQPGTSYLGMNTQITPTLDVNVRRAIASAIDREALIRDVLGQSWHVPAQTLIPPSVPGYQGDDPTVGYPFDIEAAKNYLALAGYGPQNPPPAVELWYNREGNNELLFEAVAGMLEAVGIPVRLSSAAWDVHRDALDACDAPAECAYNLYRMGWVMDYADPSSLLEVVFSPRSTLQYTGWQSEAYEALLAQARAESDEATRLSHYQQAEKLLLNEAAIVVPLLYYDRTLLVKNGVTFDFPPFGAPQLQYWQLPK
jgi:oligopeptide transport system substrate-binding protein